MDKEQEEIQFLGFFGILKESCTIISSWRKIFTQITIFLILPLSFLYLAHIQITKTLFTVIIHNEFMLLNVLKGSKSFSEIDNMLSSNSEWVTFFRFKIGYLVFFAIVSLLTTSAVVHTIACIYTAKETTLNKVLSLVPKVWKRLMITFTWHFVFVFAYNFLFLVIVIFVLLDNGDIGIGCMTFLIVLFIAYFMGLLYITMIWHLASVVSVLEDSYGLSAMMKSRGLIKGKMGISTAVFFVLGLSFFGIQHMFKNFVVLGHGDGIGKRIVYGIICLILLSISILFQLIMETMVYFVCKSYHHENIDKSSLADHLGGYLEEFIPLQFKDVQLEQFDV
ncbi:hypothetical protein ACP275_12G044100 [Erythranthe tilingii]